jgi:hypothetical protein
MPLEKGKTFTLREILDELGADDTAPPYALHKGTTIVGFALNRWQNPGAPDQILVGYGENPEAFANAYVASPTSVPVLIRERKEDCWRCVGDYRLRDWTEEPSEKNKRVRPVDIPAIYKILFMEEVHT